MLALGRLRLFEREQASERFVFAVLPGLHESITAEAHDSIGNRREVEFYNSITELNDASTQAKNVKVRTKNDPKTLIITAVQSANQ